MSDLQYPKAGEVWRNKQTDKCVTVMIDTFNGTNWVEAVERHGVVHAMSACHFKDLFYPAVNELEYEPVAGEVWKFDLYPDEPIAVRSTSDTGLIEFTIVGDPQVYHLPTYIFKSVCIRLYERAPDV